MPVSDYLQGLPAFASHFAMAIGLAVAYVLIYTHITPHREWQLIRQGVLAASLAFLGSLFGFPLPLSTAIRYSVDLLDASLWGAIALLVQVLVFVVLRFAWRDLSARISGNDVAAGAMLGGLSLGAGLLNAACMSG